MAAYSGIGSAQAEPQPYARKNSFGVLMAYSNDSSHMLLGDAENRKLLEFGVSYSRTLLLKRRLHWQFQAEFLPIAENSDPVQVSQQTVTFTNLNPPATFTSTTSSPTELACHNSSGTDTSPIATIKFVNTCTRRWVMGQALSPFGLQWNFMPRHKLQPIVTGHGGYLYSTQSIPVNGAGSFNFTFDIGAGFELYRSHTRSLRAEYRYHHISNGDTAEANPGIDSGVFQLSYVFGR